ncbi:hypothetical protein HK101_004266 [Irineochytrium annulatum]|nr:hypothetical protein HK101_004266 [Irineochytrium annulatum]
MSSVLRPIKPRFFSCPRFPTADADIERRDASANATTAVPEWTSKVHPQLPLTVSTLLTSCNEQLLKYYDPHHVAIALVIKLVLIAGHLTLDLWTPEPEHFKIIMVALWVLTIAFFAWVIRHKVKVTKEVRARMAEIEKEFNVSAATLGVSVAFCDVAKVFKRMRRTNTVYLEEMTSPTVTSTLRPVKPHFFSCPRFPRADADVEKVATSAVGATTAAVPEWAGQVDPQLPLRISTLLGDCNEQLLKFYDPHHVAVAVAIKLVLLAGHLTLDLWRPEPVHFREIMAALWVLTGLFIAWVIWHRADSNLFYQVRAVKAVRARLAAVEKEFNANAATLGVSVAFCDVAKAFKRMTIVLSAEQPAQPMHQQG